MGRLSKEQIAFGLYATEMDKIEKRHRKLDDVIDILKSKTEHSLTFGEYAMILAKNGLSMSRLTEDDYDYMRENDINFK